MNELEPHGEAAQQFCRRHQKSEKQKAAIVCLY